MLYGHTEHWKSNYGNGLGYGPSLLGAIVVWILGSWVIKMLITPDNKTIILPNDDMAGSSLINFSSEKTRRVGWTFGIGYGDSVNKAKMVIRDLADSSVNFTVRPGWIQQIVPGNETGPG